MSGTTDPNQFRELLAYYHAGLEDGSVTPAQVVAWADGVIAKDDVIDPFFADVSLAGQNTNLLLQIIAGSIDPHSIFTAHRVSLGDLYWKIERRAISPTETNRRLQRILYGSSRTYDEEQLRIMGSAENLDLAIVGIYGSVDEAMMRVKEDLSIYSGFLVEHPGSWSSANASVDAVLREEQIAREERASRLAKVQADPPRKKPWWRLLRER